MAENRADQPPAPPQVAVGAVSVHDGRLLVVRRGRAPGADRWSVPGGRVEPGETLEAAVVRELREETGLEGVVVGLCGITERIGAGYHYVIVDYWVDVDAIAGVAGDDAAELRWVSRSELERLECVGGLLDFLAEHGVLGRLQR